VATNSLNCKNIFSKATIYFFPGVPQSEKPLVLLQKAVRLTVEVVTT
jgi:hypothetical protein